MNFISKHWHSILLNRPGHPDRVLIPAISRRICATLIVACLLCAAGCGVEQVVEDEAVFHELDAFYTAVTSRRAELLSACQTRLKELHDSQRLSDAGYRRVTAISTLAHNEEWQKAAEQLYDFMRGQRLSR